MYVTEYPQVVLKITEEDHVEFSEWLSWIVDEAIRNGGQGVGWAVYTGSNGYYYELWNNPGVMSYAKLKWG